MKDVGAVLMEQVCGWLGHRSVIVRPVLDIPGIKAVDRYEFTTQMAEALRMISPAANFPYSTNLSGNGDNEHPDRYVPLDDGGPPGQTGLHNGAWTPRFPHRIKTHGKWRAKQLRPGAWLWRTPHRYCFLVDEHGTTPLGKL